jgi:hypothetical protein
MQGHGYHAYIAFRKALVLCIQFDQTLDRDQLRNALPMSAEERNKKVDPIKVMEQAAYDGNRVHQQMNRGFYGEAWVAQQTNQQMISAFHEFYLDLLKVGNIKEARQLYILERQRQKPESFRERKIGQTIGFWLWDITCGYGENLNRWVLVCISIFLIFSWMYYVFGAIAPTTGWIDYPYFSIITMTSLGYGDIHPVGSLGKILASLEIVLGLLMFGMLLTLLNRRIVQ